MTKKKPDDYHRHEAMAMAIFLTKTVYNELIENEAILNNPKWLKMAGDIHGRLYDLYNAIGKEHLGGE